MLLEGIFLPLTTPFHPDGSLYLPKLAANVRRYSLTPAAGLLIASPAGEAPSLSDSDLVSVLETAIQAAAEEKVLIAAITRPSVHATLELAALAHALVYDAIALAPGQPVLYYQLIADQSPLPILLLDATPEIIEQLAAHPNMLAASTTAPIPNLPAITREVTVTTTFQAATRRMLRHTGAPLLSPASLTTGGTFTPATPAIKTRTKKVPFQLLAADTANMLPLWQSGFQGAIPTLSPAAPQACCEVWQAFRDGDLPLAEEKQSRIQPAAALMQSPAAIKHGADLNGYFGGRPRLPALPLTEAEKQSVAHSLANLRT